MNYATKLETISEVFDICFVGGGISGTFVWQALFREFPGYSPRTIMIDKHGSFGRGLPYSNNVPLIYLLNDTVEQIDGLQRLGFARWLKREKNIWLEDLRTASATAPSIAEWIEKHKYAIDLDEYDTLYMPRRIFGDFLQDRFNTYLTELGEQGHDFCLVQGDVTNISRINDQLFAVYTSLSSDPFYVKKIVLGIGLPYNAFAPDLDSVLGYVNNIYECDIADVIQATRRIASRKGEPLRVGVLGGGPTAVEMVYLWLTNFELASLLDCLVVITTSGKLPEGLYLSQDTSLSLPHMENLHLQAVIKASDLMNALQNDIGAAAEIPVLSIRKHVQEMFTRIFIHLSDQEKREFVRRYGQKFSSLMKHTSSDYSFAINAKKGQMVIHKSRVTSIQFSEETFIIKTQNEQGNTEECKTDMVINCLGLKSLKYTSNKLIDTMREAGLIVINDAERGIAVSESFEASPNIFVIGPLLSGISFGDHHLWRLENIKRIYELSFVVARHIHSTWS